jgi:hypothetical protein
MMLAPPAAPTNTEPRVLAEISSYDDLHNALRRRSDELHGPAVDCARRQARNGGGSRLAAENQFALGKKR